MPPEYTSVDASFRSEIKDLIRQRKYLAVQYFTDIRELISTRAIIQQVVQRNEAEFVLLSTGEEIRLDRIVRLGDRPAPGFHIDDFTCDC